MPRAISGEEDIQRATRNSEIRTETKTSAGVKGVRTTKSPKSPCDPKLERKKLGVGEYNAKRVQE